MNLQGLIDLYGEPIRTEQVPCTTDQWNFPHERNQPWAKNGVCSICGQTVEMVRVGPDLPSVYSHISEPHLRTMHWFAVQHDELLGLHDYMETY